MWKYVGKYRVASEFDRVTLKPLKDTKTLSKKIEDKFPDTYIRCYNDGQIYRYSKDVLAYYRPNSSYGYACNLADKFEANGIKVLDNHPSDEDILLYFYEKDLDKVASLVGAITKGKDIKPTSIKNLRTMSWYKG